MNTLTPSADEAAPTAIRPASQRVAVAVFMVGLVVAAGAIIAILFFDLPKQLTGALVVLLGIVPLLMGIPVGVAMLGAALLGLWALSGGRSGWPSPSPAGHRRWRCRSPHSPRRRTRGGSTAGSRSCARRSTRC